MPLMIVTIPIQQSAQELVNEVKEEVKEPEPEEVFKGVEVANQTNWTPPDKTLKLDVAEMSISSRGDLKITFNKQIIQPSLLNSDSA